MLDVALTPRAQLDLESIYLYIAVVGAAPKAADSLIEGLYAEIDRLAEFPELGHNFTNEALARPYRRMLCRSYWIYYYVEHETLTVVRVFHTSQDIDDYAAIDL